MENTRFTIDIDKAVRDYADTVYRLAVANTKVLQDAEDVFQEVFVKLVRYQHTIESEEHLKAWLIRVTINECRSLESSSWKRKVTLDDGGGSEDAVSILENQSDGTSTEEAYIQSEQNSDIVRAVQNLPQKYREVIHLFYFEEMKISEIAEALSTNEATVKTRLKRARSLLEKTLKGGVF